MHGGCPRGSQTLSGDKHGQNIANALPLSLMANHTDVPPGWTVEPVDVQMERAALGLLLVSIPLICPHNYHWVCCQFHGATWEPALPVGHGDWVE